MLVSQLLRTVILIAAVAIVSLPLSAADTSELPSVDVRVIVDISGSMKQNDPENLRIPAIQLFSQLLPPDSQAGVWTFGQYVNMLVPLAPVDNAWKDEAVRSSKQINSVGLYTNIGGAIERAAYGWSEPDEAVKRSLILLTDGVVDISPDQNVNATARSELLDNVLPRLQKAGVTIHTIALSGDADEDLLSQLAGKTDGWYQKVVQASQLQKVFLKIFGQATERESIPLLNNSFKVDEQISEFTLLVFKSGNSKPTRLKQPNGGVLDASQDSPEISWFEADGYDVVTVSQPMTGLWQVEAEVDPDNQVLVVSNIKVKSSDIPNNLLANETINIEMFLNQDKERVTDQQFLDLIKMQLDVEYDGTEDIKDFLDNGEDPDKLAKDGIYSVTFTAGAEEGLIELTTSVQSPTFQRIRERAINVYASPIEVSHELATSSEQFHRLIVTPRRNIINPELTIITGTVTLPDGETMPLELQGQEDFVYQAEIKAFDTGGVYKFNFDVNGFTQNQRVFRVEPPTYLVDAPALVTEQNNNEAEVDSIVESEPLVDEYDIDWLFWFGMAGAANVVFVLLYLLFNMFGNKRNIKLANELGAQLENTNG